ncbi:MAG: hypothetical protein EAS52_11980 [Parapedobacter sp.]|nr:MAG: hypothetical protein EAS52_11980 [Parapedobacter sp.]
MDNIGHIEIRIEGTKGNFALSPDNYDIREVIAMLENAENLLFPNDKKGRPTISYQLESGSVRHLFKTSMQYVIGFNAVIAQVDQHRSIDFLDLNTAKALENIQDNAAKHGYVVDIRTSLEDTHTLRIDTHTDFRRSEAIWAEAEFYFYGKVTNAGGKDKANIHMFTDEHGTLRIHTPIRFLESYENNMLYKHLGVRAKGKQHSDTGEIDTSSLTFLELVEYHPKYDEDYLNNLIEKASDEWRGIADKDAWLREIRGGYDG